MIATFLWYERDANKAAKHYVKLLGGKIVARDAITTTFELGGNRFIAFDGGPTFQLNEAASIMVTCKTQKEIDRLWTALVRGGRPSQCGWLVDRWGMWWQIIPEELPALIRDPRGMQAMLKMSKIDLAALRAAVTDSRTPGGETRRRRT